MATMGTRGHPRANDERTPSLCSYGREGGGKNDIDVDKGEWNEERGKMPGVRPITQADGANQGAMRLP